MSDSNAFSAGLAAKVVLAFADCGGTPAEANRFAENEPLVKGMFDVLRGRAKIEYLKIERSEIIIPELEMDFISEEYFKVDISSDALVRISELGDDFCNKFLPNVIMPRKSFFLKSRIMSQYECVCGQMKKSDLSAIWYLLAQQKNGPRSKEGALLTDGLSNIFCCEDLSGTPWAICVRWCNYGWNINAYLIVPSGGWFGETILMFL